MRPADFEKKTGLSGYDAHRLLRVSKSKYYEWRRGERPIPPYIEASMEAHAACGRDAMDAMLARRRMSG